jgi:hypothetical protein
MRRRRRRLNMRVGQLMEPSNMIVMMEEGVRNLISRSEGEENGAGVSQIERITMSS